VAEVVHQTALVLGDDGCVAGADPADCVEVLDDLVVVLGNGLTEIGADVHGAVSNLTGGWTGDPGSGHEESPW